LQGYLELHTAMLLSKAAGIANVADVHVGHNWQEQADVRVHVAFSTLVSVLVEGANGSFVGTARYGSHFFRAECFGNGQVFDGQHDESPKGGWVWVSELCVGLAGHIASTVPDQAKHWKTPKRDEKHGIF
jgi:hypothetical protein